MRANNTSETAVEVTWDRPEGNFDGFNISCDGENQAIDVISALYRNPGIVISTFCISICIYSVLCVHIVNRDIVL